MFLECSDLQELDIRQFDTTETTNMEAMFKECSKLQELDVSQFNTANVTSLYQMFSGCSKLQKLDISKFVIWGGRRRSANIGSICYGCQSLTGNLVLPEGLEELGEDAFYECKNLTEVVFPEGLISIGERAFCGCEGLTGLKFPESLESIGEEAFAYCSGLNLQEILPEARRIEDLSENAFFDWFGDFNAEYYSEMKVGEKNKISLKVSGHTFSYPLIEWSIDDENIATIEEDGTITAKTMGNAIITVKMTDEELTEEIGLRVVAENIPGIKKENCTWYIPETVKIGYQFHKCTGQCGGLTVVKVENLPEDSIGKQLVISYGNNFEEVRNYFSLPHAYGAGRTITSIQEAYGETCLECAVAPGSFTMQPQICYQSDEDDTGDWIENDIEAPYKVTVEAPVIETNEPSQVNTGDTITLQSELKNTELKDEDVSIYEKELEKVKGQESYCLNHSPVYKPEYIIESGAGLVKRSAGNFSHTLSASEKLEFTGAGTVKIKVRYKALEMCTFPDMRYYSPEKTITIQVNGNGQGGTSSEGEGGSKNDAVKKKVSRITITGISNKIAAGKKIKLTAKVSPSDAANKKVEWKSSNKKVATVNSSGVVTMKANSGGKKVTITATAKDKSGVKATYKITSMKGRVKKIAISGGKSVKAGKTLKLKAKVTATKKANKKLKWKSSNTKYATVNSSGKVTAKKAGKNKKVKITAEATDGSKVKKSVTVKIK